MTTRDYAPATTIQSGSVIQLTETTLTDEARTVTVENPQGLHARPVMRFVDLASRFQSRVRVRKGECVVDGKNPMEMMLLEASQGAHLEILTSGPDAVDAIQALADLVASGFGEL